MPCPDRKIIKAYFAPEEYEKIKTAAAQAKLSVSKYVQTVCLGYEVKSKTDHEAALAMLEVNRDLSRLGNLLKMVRSQEGYDVKKVDELIKSISESKAVLMEKVNAI